MNHATNTTIFNITTATDNQFNNKSTDNKETIIKLKKNYISVFHVKAEFDNNNKQENSPIQNIHIYKYPHFIAFRDYIHGLRKGIESGLNNYMDVPKTQTNYFNMNVPNGMALPVMFFHKFHNKGSDLATNVHRAIFGRKFEHDRDIG